MDVNNTAISHQATTFLSGPAGAGKTTLATQHLRALLEAGIAGDSIFVLAPQRSLLQPFQQEAHRANLPPGSLVELLTLGGLARRCTMLFWPAVAAAGGFARPQDPPIFLTLETAQYYMQRVVAPLMAEAGYFEGIRVQPNRLYSQILDNLNKAAVVGFSHLEIGQRLRDAWSGPSSRAVIFSQVQDCAERFRQFCLHNNLLDFSLQVELLTHHLLNADWFCRYLFGRYRRLIVDNVEEDTPVTHDLLRRWLAECDSALIVCDTEAGFRRFLGADPDGALALRSSCRHHIELNESHVTSPNLETLATEMARHVGQQKRRQQAKTPTSIRTVLDYGGGRFHPQMLDWVTDEITRLVKQENIPAGEIVVLAPYLSDALRFALSDRLARAGVPAQSLRPSRALNEEPAARCLLTLAALAHPAWGIGPAQADVAHALTMTIDGLDPVRAHLLAQRGYKQIQDSKFKIQDSRFQIQDSRFKISNVDAQDTEQPARHVLPLQSFDVLVTELQDRIGYEIGERYETLRAWLNDRLAEPPFSLDHFLSRLFGEVLSQPGFAFHRDLDSGRVAAGLIASARKFRQVVDPHPNPPSQEEGSEQVGRAYVDMVRNGVIAAEYGRTPDKAGAVLLAPAYTFLLSNRPVEVQFWINAGSPGWWERLYQPLTHPYVLTRWWPAGKQWADDDEQAARAETLRRLILGLVRRCRRKVYLAFSTLNEQGFEERGPLLMVAQQVLRNLPTSEEGV